MQNQYHVLEHSTQTHEPQGQPARLINWQVVVENCDLKPHTLKRGLDSSSICI